MPKNNRDYKLYFYGLFAAVLLLLIFKFDFQIARFITGLRFGALDSVMLVFTPAIFQIILVLAASIIVYLSNKKKILHLWFSIAVSLAVSIILKAVIARPRPFVEGISALSSLIKESYTRGDFSFPSNHALIAFVALPFLPKKWFWPWLIISCIVAFSRVYFGLHYLSDVIAGAALGILVSYLTLKLK